MDRSQRRRLETRLTAATNEIKEVKDLLKRDEREDYVVVTFPGSSSRYVYSVDDPCKVGDYCLVHARGRDQLVKVVDLGRGTWQYSTKSAKRIGSASWIHARLRDLSGTPATSTFYGFTHAQLLDAIDYARVRGWEQQATSDVTTTTVAPATKLITNGTYRVVCSHVEERDSTASGRRYWMATHVVIGPNELGALLYQPLMDHGPATWIWEDAGVDHPKDLLGHQLFADVRQEVYERQRRMKVGKLTLVEVARDDTDEDPFRGSEV